MASVLNLSEHFTLDELTISQEAARCGEPNEPNAAQIGNLRGLCAYILEPLRIAVGKPVIVSSGFRSVAVNAIVKGSRFSDHMQGLAADITIPGMTPLQVCQKITELKLPARQIICEFGRWTHVSLSKDPANPPELLTASLVGGKVTYSKGLA